MDTNSQNKNLFQEQSKQLLDSGEDEDFDLLSKLNEDHRENRETIVEFSRKGDFFHQDEDSEEMKKIAEQTLSESQQNRSDEQTLQNQVQSYPENQERQQQKENQPPQNLSCVILPQKSVNPQKKEIQDQKQSNDDIRFENLPDDEILHKMIENQEEFQVSDPQNQVAKKNQNSTQKSFDETLNGSIKMICEKHNAPAVFYSEPLDCYMCFRCLASTGKLLYIDKSYKQEVEDFERIRDLTAQAVKQNLQNTVIIKEWKKKIRHTLMNIKTEFNKNIDNFINLFGEKFKDVEMSPDLLEFRGEDKKLQNVVEDIQKKYVEILGIFNNIANANAQNRIKYIDNIKSYMKGIERKVKDQDFFIKTQSKKLREALDKTVSLDGIQQKMEIKLIKYLNKEAKKKYDTRDPNLNNDQLNLDDTQTIFQDMQYRNSSLRQKDLVRRPLQNDQRMLESMDLSAIDNFNEIEAVYGEDHDIHLRNRRQGFQFGQSALAQKTVKPQQKQIIELYRHKGLNSLYSLKASSQIIYLLDFKKQSFVKEKVISDIILPSCFSSCQTDNGQIYIVGGLFNEIILKSVYKLDQSLNQFELSSMKIPRFTTPIILLKDNFILAAGGQINSKNKFKYTDAVEIYDIKNDSWQQISPMQQLRGNTSMSQIANRFVFIFNGLPNGVQSNVKNSIEFIDLGLLDLQSIKKSKWELVPIQNSEFPLNDPRGCSKINENEILIFGGQSRNTYIADMSQIVNPKHQQVNFAKITKLQDSQMMSDTKFCIDSDFTVRIFGNYLYAVDAKLNYLHVYSIKDKQWNYSSLVDLGIE